MEQETMLVILCPEVIGEEGGHHQSATAAAAGHVWITPQDSLAHVRQLIVQQFDHDLLPSGNNNNSFAFTCFPDKKKNNVQVRISQRQEEFCKAIKYLDLRLSIVAENSNKRAKTESNVASMNGSTSSGSAAAVKIKVTKTNDDDDDDDDVLEVWDAPKRASSQSERNEDTSTSLQVKVEDSATVEAFDHEELIVGNTHVIPDRAPSSTSDNCNREDPDSQMHGTLAEVRVLVDCHDETVTPRTTSSPPAVSPEMKRARSDSHMNSAISEVGLLGTLDDETVTSNETPDENASPPTISPEVKKELTRQERQSKRKESYGKYGHHLLLARHDSKGIPRLGGGHQNTFPCPAADNRKVFDEHGRCDPHYPLPKHLDPADEKLHCNKEFVYACYSGLWQPNAPRYAGQPTAAVDVVPGYAKETGIAFPVFIKRTLTLQESTSEGNLLGWEYCGNYRYLNSLADSNDGSCDGHEEFSFWESASNFSKASKKTIASKIFESSKSDDGYGRAHLNQWRPKLVEALKSDLSPAAPRYMVEGRRPTQDEMKEPQPPLAARARALKFRANMTDEDLCHLLMEIDEFHGQHVIQFVEYDERIYEFCKDGATNRNSKGKQKKSPREKSATARDWYNFAEEHMLFSY